MAYSSSHFVETQRFCFTTDSITVMSCFRGFMDPNDSFLPIWTIDYLTGEECQVSISRNNLRAFRLCLQRRCGEMYLILRDFCDVIAPGLTLGSHTIMYSNNTHTLFALRFCMIAGTPMTLIYLLICVGVQWNMLICLSAMPKPWQTTPCECLR